MSTFAPPRKQYKNKIIIVQVNMSKTSFQSKATEQWNYVHVNALFCADTKGWSESICHAYSTAYRPTLNGKTDSEPEQEVPLSNFPPSASPHMKSSNYLKGRVLYWPSKESIYLNHWCTAYIKGFDRNFWKQLCPILHMERLQRASWFVFRNRFFKFGNSKRSRAALLKHSDHSQMQ